MRPSKRRRVLFWIIDGITALFDGPAPLHWLSIADQASSNLNSRSVSLYEFDDGTYIIEGPGPGPFGGWVDLARSAGQGTLTTGRTDTHVMLTEVTDSVLKRQLLALGRAVAVPKSFPIHTPNDPAVFEVTPG